MRALAEREQQTVPETLPPRVVVPIRRLNAPALRALGYALSIAKRATVVQLPRGEDPGLVRKRLRNLGLAGRLEFLESNGGEDPVELILDSLDTIAGDEPGRPIAVVLAPIVPRHRWLLPLHDQGGRLRKRLVARPGTAVVDVRFQV